MLKWKTSAVVIVTANTEIVNDILSGKPGKTLTVKYLAGTPTASLRIRAYRTSDQMVDFDSFMLTAAAPLLPVDVPLKQGDTFKAGFQDLGAGAGTYYICVGYEESE